MIRIAICDDVPEHCSIAKEKITSYFSGKSVTISIDTYFSGSELLRCDVCYDLLIMDIALRDENGMDVAKKYCSGKRTRVILLSSHNEELPNGYKIGAFRFLLKPIDDISLQEALDSAVNALEQEQVIEVFDEKGCSRFLRLSEIYYIQGAHKKSNVFTEMETFTSPVGIQQISAELHSLSFFMPHKSYLINLRYVQSIGDKELVLTSKERIPISRLQRKNFLERYHAYMRSTRYED